MTSPLGFIEFEHIAEYLHDPSEAHGMLCAMLCADPHLDADLWMEQIRAEGLKDDLATPDLLLELVAATVSQLNNDDMDVRLLLPSDENTLALRVDSLGHWCEGFIVGLGLGGLSKEISLSAEVREFLDDLANIARGGFDTDTADEADEEAYAEIVEYVRMGVLLVRQELHALHGHFSSHRH